MNEYTYSFTHKAENYEIRLIGDKVEPDHYLVLGQQLALQALGLQSSSLVTLADLRARFEACKVAIAIQRAYDGEDESIITQALAREMLTAQSPDAPNGLGVFVDTLKKSIVFHHPGENAGFKCVLIANNAKQGACVMTNSEHGQALWKDVVRSIAKECAWPDSDSLPMCKPLCTAAEVDPIADKNKWIAKYAGIYSQKDGASIEVTAECLIEEGCPPYEIVCLGKGVCIFREFTPGPPDKFYFSEDAAGAITLHVFDKEFIKN